MLSLPTPTAVVGWENINIAIWLPTSDRPWHRLLALGETREGGIFCCIRPPRHADKRERENAWQFNKYDGSRPM